MYYHTGDHWICSECNSLDAIEHVTRKNQTFIRCTRCGHEKLTSTLTVSHGNEESDYYVSPPAKQQLKY